VVVFPVFPSIGSSTSKFHALLYGDVDVEIGECKVVGECGGAVGAEVEVVDGGVGAVGDGVGEVGDVPVGGEGNNECSTDGG